MGIDDVLAGEAADGSCCGGCDGESCSSTGAWEDIVVDSCERSICSVCVDAILLRRNSDRG